jgi:hypothetical protein
MHSNIACNAPGFTESCNTSLDDWDGLGGLSFGICRFIGFPDLINFPDGFVDLGGFVAVLAFVLDASGVFLIFSLRFTTVLPS